MDSKPMEARDNTKSHEDEHGKEGVSIKSPEDMLYEEEEPVFDGTEIPGMDGKRSRSSDNYSEKQGSAWPNKAVALSHDLKRKSMGAMSTVICRLSGKNIDELDVADVDRRKGDKDLLSERVDQKVPQKSTARSEWDLLSLIGRESKSENEDSVGDLATPIYIKGRILFYTRLGCQDCRENRRYLWTKGLNYVEININFHPSKRLEIENIAECSAAPTVFFNEILIGGLSELKELGDSITLGEKIEYVFIEEPSYEAPWPPPLSGKRDQSSDGAVHELAHIARKTEGSISIKDRVYIMRRYTNRFQHNTTYHCYFDFCFRFRLEGKVDLNSGGVDRALICPPSPQNHRQMQPRINQDVHIQNSKFKRTSSRIRSSSGRPSSLSSTRPKPRPILGQGAQFRGPSATKITARDREDLCNIF